MVVLAASVVTKSGKALVSRQFVDMSRIRIEGLLAAFPKLVGSGKQHTYVETENVRYVYQPIEGMYLLLVTNKASNILEDLETLRLMSKVLPEYVLPPVDEETIVSAAFELLFAFDEVISLGYKENVTVGQVKQNTEMESHEEKLHKMIIQSKVQDTKDLMKRKAMEIEKSKIESARAGKTGTSNYNPSGPSSINISNNRSATDLDLTPTFSRPDTSSLKPKAGAAPKKGMQLGKARKANDFLESLRAEGEVIQVDNGAAATSSAAPSAGVTPAIPSEPISLLLKESVIVILQKDGGVDNMEVQGTIALQVQDEQFARVRVLFETGSNPGYQFKTHPNIDKQLYGSNILGNKDADRPFPTGSALPILKWRMQTKDEDMVPLTINCWPSISGNESYVNIEYECQADFDLQSIVVAIPCPQPPKVNQVDGDYHYDSRKQTLLWTVDLIDDSNRQGAMEFVISSAANPDSFFPVDVSFSAQHTLADVKVVTVVGVDDEQPVRYSAKSLLNTEVYQVV
ncbi:g546 [Coccomyxa viridis]|uniref:Coatomer subunit delta n=1 Tax=Coccomyxa viridis TaxID=1274662 RepID=A0ABP1FMN7_9CHLO